MATQKKATKKATPRKRVPQSKKQIGTRMAIDSAIARNKEQAERDAGGELIVTEASAWKGKADATGTKLALPSGNVCLAVNKGLMPFIEQGAIPNALMPLVLDAISSGKGMNKKAMDTALSTPEALADVMRMADHIVVASVLQPVILAVPTWTSEDAAKEDCPESAVGQQAPSKKDPSHLYIDEVDMNDKMFVFQWVVGGTRDLERFREQSAAALEDLAAEQDVEGAAE